MAVKLKFRALLTMCGDPVENGELVIDEGKVVEIFDQLGKEKNMDVLDLSDCLLMPGFVNAHSHLGLTALEKKLNPYEFFAEWIRALIRLNAKLDSKSRVLGIHAGAEEMQRSGVTALGDYVAEPEMLKELDGLGFRSVLFLEIIGFQAEKAETLCNEVEDILKKGSLSPLNRFGLAPHAPYSVSPNLFRGLGQIARRYNCPLSCHVAEIKEESRFLVLGEDSLEELLKERSAWDPKWQPPYKSSVQYLSSLGVLDRLVAVHCNFVSDDIDIMRQKKVSTVFCPQSTNWFRRTPSVPVRALLDRGMTVALGTDSKASNDSLNFLDELRMADKLLPDVNRKEILDMATRAGGVALGLECGKLACGFNADLIGFRLPPSFSGSWSDVPFESQRREVDFYMVNGKVKTFSPGTSL